MRARIVTISIRMRAVFLRGHVSLLAATQADRPRCVGTMSFRSARAPTGVRRRRGRDNVRPAAVSLRCACVLIPSIPRSAQDSYSVFAFWSVVHVSQRDSVLTASRTYHHQRRRGDCQALVTEHAGRGSPRVICPVAHSAAGVSASHRGWLWLHNAAAANSGPLRS